MHLFNGLLGIKRKTCLLLGCKIEIEISPAIRIKCLNKSLLRQLGSHYPKTLHPRTQYRVWSKLLKSQMPQIANKNIRRILKVEIVHSFFAKIVRYQQRWLVSPGR